MVKEFNVSNKSNNSNKSKYFSGNSVKIDCDRERDIEEKVENRKSDVKEEENDDYVFLDAT